jgi:hypothetical protein
MPPKKNTKRKDPPPPAEEAATDPANELAEPPSSDKKKKKGRALSVPNFTEEEDYVLCVAYVNVSQNPIKGTDQASADIWSDIETKYSMETEKTHPGNPYPKRPSLSQLVSQQQIPKKHQENHKSFHAILKKSP